MAAAHVAGETAASRTSYLRWGKTLHFKGVIGRVRLLPYACLVPHLILRVCAKGVVFSPLFLRERLLSSRHGQTRGRALGSSGQGS